MERKTNEPEEEAKTEEIEPEIYTVQDVISSLQGMKPLADNSSIEPDPIFNDVVLLQIIKQDANKKTEKKADDEDFILKTFDKLLASACNLVTFGGIEYFIKYKSSLYKQILLSYKSFYRAHISGTKQIYHGMQKELIVKYLSLLHEGKTELLEKEIDSLLFKDAGELKTPFLATPDEFLFEALQHLVVSSNLTNKIRNKLIHKIMKIYLFNKMIQIYIKKKLSKEQQEELSFEGFMKDITSGTISQLKEEIVNGMLSCTRKVVVFLLLNGEISKENTQILSNGDYLNDESELNAYLRIEGLDTSVNDFLSAKIFEITGISQESVKRWFEGISQDNNKLSIDRLSPSVLLADQDIGFSFINLPENYYDLSTTYIEKKCQICRNRSEAGNQCICLLCGMILCSWTCKKKIKSLVHSIGNLNNHATLCHAGECAFLNVETGKIYLMKTPKNIEYDALYVDRLGYALEDKGKDWKKYKVDKALLDNLREKFIYGKVAQEVSYNIMNKGKKIYDSLL